MGRLPLPSPFAPQALTQSCAGCRFCCAGRFGDRLWRGGGWSRGSDDDALCYQRAAARSAGRGGKGDVHGGPGASWPAQRQTHGPAAGSAAVSRLDDSGGARRWSLAAVGANARRATEDSTTIGYIGELAPAATRSRAFDCRIGRHPRSSLDPAFPGVLRSWRGSPSARSAKPQRFDEPARKPLCAKIFNLSPQQVLQRLADLGMAELVPEVERPPGNHPLPSSQHMT